MVVPSKVFEPPICVNHCSQSILHPGIGCLRYFFNNLLNNSIGGLKYFSPLLITPLVLKSKTMNKELFLSTLKYYLKTVFWTAMASSTSFYCICLFRNILGRFLKYTTLFMPTVLGMQFFWFLPDKAMKLFCTATSQAVYEGLLRQYPNTMTNILLHSTFTQTFLFMVNSAIILHYKRLHVYKEFWFMQPYPKMKESDYEQLDNNANVKENSNPSVIKCVHGHIKCSKFLLDGLKIGMACGIPMDLLSALMKGKVPKGCKGLGTAIWAKLKTFRPNMAGFFVFYAAIYRLSSCLLHKYYGHLSADLQHLVAGFLGGSAYLWVNKVSFYTLSTVIAIQALWDQFCIKVSQSKDSKTSKRKPNLALLLLKDISFSRIVFSLNMGYLVHNFIINYEVLNGLTRGFLDGVTSNQTKIIRESITQNSLEELVAIAKSNAVKTFL
uniref:Transmembrane protein 135 N-terminal domain-containing protein n=2 Tax=Stomoxys calcitrans TaxID=35570 RepID=A0A1I8P5Z2_STOCA